jgi:hypothetical protein
VLRIRVFPDPRIVTSLFEDPVVVAVLHPGILVELCPHWGLRTELRFGICMDRMLFFNPAAQDGGTSEQPDSALAGFAVPRNRDAVVTVVPLQVFVTQPQELTIRP